MYALLHDADPGEAKRDRVMSTGHASLYLHAEFAEPNAIRVTGDLRFIAARRVTPRFVTVWDGPEWRATVPITVNHLPNAGDVVQVALEWTMLRPGDI